jgi:GGDEF domain-containing protein
LKDGRVFLDGHALEPQGRPLKSGSRLIIGERAYLAWLGGEDTRRARLQTLRFSDPLTGLPLRPALLRHLGEKAPGGLLCFELDGLVQARLEYGDGAGLWLTSAVAILVLQRLSPPALLAWLDDAFALFLPRATERSLRSAARALCDRVENESFGLDGAFVQLRCGGAMVTGREKPEACLEQALEKMAEARYSGNGPVVV